MDGERWPHSWGKRPLIELRSLSPRPGRAALRQAGGTEPQRQREGPDSGGDAGRGRGERRTPARCDAGRGEHRGTPPSRLRRSRRAGVIESASCCRKASFPASRTSWTSTARRSSGVSRKPGLRGAIRRVQEAGGAAGLPRGRPVQRPGQRQLPLLHNGGGDRPGDGRNRCGRVSWAGIGTGRHDHRGRATPAESSGRTCRSWASEPRLGERLQGLRSLSEGYIPPLLDLGLLNRRFLVDSASAIEAGAGT